MNDMQQQETQEERIRREFATMVGFDSVSLNERACADWLRERLEELGFEVEEDDAGRALGGNAGNLHAWLPGTLDEDPILLCGHMDVVEPGRGKRAIFHEDGRITSDGATVLGADDIAAIVEILEGVRAVLASGRAHRGIELLFCVDEEAYDGGSRVFDYRALRSSEAYVLDVSGAPGTAAIAAPTLISFTVTVAGKAAHAGFEPEAGINAIACAAAAVAGLVQGHVNDHTTLNIGTIAGGAQANVVPERCVCTGEIRSSDHAEALQTVETVRLAFETAAERYGAQVHVESEVRIKAYRTSTDAVCVKRFQAACQELGLDGTLIETFGGSDNNSLAEHGIEGIVLSCGFVNPHSTTEYVRMRDLLVGAQLVEALIG